MQSEAANSNPFMKVDWYAFWINIRYKLWLPFVVGTLVGVAVYLVALRVITDRWQATTYVIRHEKNMSKQSAVPYLYLETDLSTVIETIQLRENLLTVIENLSLNSTPESLRRIIAIQKGRKSNVIKISVTHANVNSAVDIADSVTTTFLKSYARVQNSAATRIHDYSEKKLAATQAALVVAQQEKKRFQTEHDLLDYEAEKESLYRIVSELKLRLMDEKIKLSDLFARLEQVQVHLSETDHTTLLSEVVRENRSASIEALSEELDALRERYTDGNPKIQNVLHRISVAEENAPVKQQDSPPVDETKYGYNPVFGELSLLKIQLETEMTALAGNIVAYEQNIERHKNKIGMLIERQLSWPLSDDYLGRLI